MLRRMLGVVLTEAKSWLVFFGTWVLVSILFSAASTFILFKLIVSPHEPELGRAAGGVVALVLGLIIGMTLGLFAMYFIERWKHKRTQISPPSIIKK